MDIIEAPGNAPVQAAEEWNEEEVKELESQEWIDSLDYVLDSGGHQRVTEILKELVLQGASTAELKAAAIKGGMCSLRMSGIKKILDGVTTAEEVLRVTMAD